ETGKTSILATIPYGGYTWTPGAEDSGEKELRVSVRDTAGRLYESEFVRVTVDGGPRLLVMGIRPGQVLTDPVEISFQSNVNVNKINLFLTDKSTGIGKYIAKDYSIDKLFELSLSEIGHGQMSIRAEGFYNGEKVLSADVPFEIYMGTLYEAKPVVEKDMFLDFASNLASESWEKTGMSAAMQTAQAILETGWGQSVPVDKYNGKFSNNLFGIKGTGSKGYVTSNTWEVYNGVEYRVDDEFRAYSDVREGWEDHKNFLLERARYRPFTEVMYDSTLGAWAIKRAGYATDPVYATKLINIIKRYGLRRLDQTGI
ncbi:MAG TPA: glucosaminidase domain-containing protein, partial [Clostridia bacterium]|nr:glucosaminidase domain-containing protein [Clostridia bacterium]